ncbi:MAG: hypothetical protein WC330_02955 [Candidatus Omnitrophota bacterium]|jgi:predicted ATP-grasp superfamily ATP-dependent carboligase
MQNFKKEHLAVVLGLSACGLGVIRSLGRENITVLGMDYETDGHDGFYSKYAKSMICPHPVYNPEQLFKFMVDRFGKKEKKPILFPTADEFVQFISDYRDKLEKYFLFNISSKEIIDSIIDKKIQYELAKKVGVTISETYYPESIEDIYNLKDKITYPLIIKGRYSFKWREVAGGTLKGLKVNNGNELVEKCREIFEKKTPVIIQKIIIGPNANHFKFCAYINREGKILTKFTLRKIRQYPVDFGVGSCVESLEYEELSKIGENFFKGINYIGVGSAEFKLDLNDKTLKLIELNPRYWMQNEQAAYCGVNFSLAQYLDLSNQAAPAIEKFKTGVRWINPLHDLKSYIEQNKNDKLFLFHWGLMLLKCQVFAVFSWKDMKPFLASLNYGLKLFRFPYLLLKILTKR